MAPTLLAILFLTPWAALATAVGAASIPIIIHLLNRKRFRVVPWAAMRFLLAAQKRTSRKLRIEQWLLLAIRTLLILLLIGAMVSVLGWAEPLWSRLFPSGVAAVAAKTGRTHRIIAIDGSFSMGRRHVDGASFDRACALAKQLIQDASPGDGFSLLLLGSPVQTIVQGPSDNGANVVNEIQQLRLPHGNSDLAGGLAALDKMVTQPLGKYHQREVYILTDLQRTFFQGAVKGLNASKAEPSSSSESRSPEADAWQRLQSRASVVLIDVARQGADNLAVTNLFLGEPLAMANSLNAVTATIHNFGSAGRDQLKVELLIGKARPGDDEGKAEADAEPFSLKVIQQLLVNVPAGDANASVPVTFPIEFTTPGEYIIQVRIENDALDLDNVRSLAVRVRESVRVALINGKPGAERDDQATHHLAVALNPNPGSRASLSPFRPKVMTEAEFADEELGDLTRFDCVFLCDVARLTESKIARLENFLRKGGGVIFCLGPQVDLEAYNRLLWKSGNGLLPAELKSRVRLGGEQVFTLTADEKNFQQAPLAAFSDENDRATFLSARFREYLKVSLSPAAKTLLSFFPPNSVKPPPGSAGTSVLDPAVVEWPRHRGRVILITTTANIDWNSWAGSPAYLPFFHELTRHAALGAPPRVVNAGEPLVEYLPAKFFGFDANLALPDGRTATVPVQEQDKVAVVRFPDTDQSGIYRMTIGASRREYLFAVNVPASTSTALASESDLRRIEADDLRAAAPDGDLQVVTELSKIKHRARLLNQPDDAESAARSSAGPTVARVLLLLFLALLVVEMTLAWLFGSARTVVPPDTIVAKPKPTLWRIFDPRNITYFPLLIVVIVVAVLIHDAFTDEFLGFLPNGWRSAMERSLEIPVALPGEGTRWKLDYLPYLTGQGSADRWLAAALIASAAALAIGIYCFERIATRVRVPGERSPANRPFWPLAGMRFGLLLLTLIVFLPQLRLFFEREGWPDVVILIDTSRSMNTHDKYQDSRVEDRAEQLTARWQEMAKARVQQVSDRIAELEKDKNASPSPDRLAAIDRELLEQKELLEELNPINRLNLVKALVAPPERDWLNSLLSKRQVKVHIYECSSKAVRLAEVIDPQGCEPALNAIREMRPLGDSSQLGGAVRAVLNDFRGGSLGAIVMLTDGVTTEGDDLAQAARYAARADVPLFFVGVGDALEPRDLVLHDLQAADSVNVHDRLVFDVRVSVKGKLAASAVNVTLSEKNPDGTLKELKVERATLDAGKPVAVRLTTTPTEPGDKTYVITVPEQPDETDKTNNHLEKAVHVADVKMVKLLYIEGRPRYEYRFLKTLLERELASKKGNRSIELKSLLVDADRNFAVQDKTALAEFPGRTELFAFDAVILGDVDPKHAKMGEVNLRLLRDFVREKGGGLLFIAGEDFMPLAYRDTPLADVLPVVVSAFDDTPANERAILDAGRVNGYRATLTPIGQQHPIFRLATDDAQNATIWSQMPPLMWAATGYRTKPAAEVLAVHPQLPAHHGNAASESDLHPLVVQQFVGAGRTMLFGFDETWRWRWREFEQRYNQFWLQAVRYLARSRLGRVEIRLDKQTPYRRHEPIRVTVRFPDDQPPPAEGVKVKVLVERGRLRVPGHRAAPETVETQTIQLTKIKGSRATYEALLTRTPEGEYKFWLAAPPVDGPRPFAEGRVLPPPGELDRLRMNQAEMKLAAKESHGRFFLLADADSLIENLPAGTRVSLNQPRPPWLVWNHAGMFALAIGLLTSEWILRKRIRLL